MGSRFAIQQTSVTAPTLLLMMHGFGFPPWAITSPLLETAAMASPLPSRPRCSGRERHLTLSIAYTYLDQKSTGVDTDNDSLGGDAYNQLQPNSDYGTDSFVSRHRVVAYGVIDLPVGRGQRSVAA